MKKLCEKLSAACRCPAAPRATRRGDLALSDTSISGDQTMRSREPSSWWRARASL